MISLIRKFLKNIFIIILIIVFLFLKHDGNINNLNKIKILIIEY